MSFSLSQVGQLNLQGLSTEQQTKLQELSLRISHKRNIKESQIKEIQSFLLPFFLCGWDSDGLEQAIEKLPLAWPLDHREVYFDFRLNCWQQILEPQSLEFLIEECFEHSFSPQQAYARISATIEEIYAKKRAELKT